MSLLKFNRDTNNMYYFQGKKISLKKIEQLIREGHEIEVKARIILDGDHEDTLEIPYTKETLYRVAFRECLNNFADKALESIIEYNCFLLRDEALYEIIENGGICEYKLKFMKGNL